MYCSKCGKDNKTIEVGDKNYCSKCGEVVNKANSQNLEDSENLTDPQNPAIYKKVIAVVLSIILLIIFTYIRHIMNSLTQEAQKTAEHAKQQAEMHLKQTQDELRKSDLEDIQKSLKLYYSINDSYPESLDGLKRTYGQPKMFYGKSEEKDETLYEHQYSDELSKDPKTGQNYDYAYIDKDHYKLSATLEATEGIYTVKGSLGK